MSKNPYTGQRSGFHPRTATEEIRWHGFNLKRGMIFGEYKGEFLVFTGCMKTFRRKDGTCVSTAKVFSLMRSVESIDPYWEQRWIRTDDKVEGIIARNFIKRLNKNVLCGITVSSDNRNSTHNGRALFNSSMSGRGMNNPYTLNERVHGWG